jgi:hypothetical protein
MSVFRSYFSKNNTLIENNRTNTSQNPVTEISYGTLRPQVSRFIFEIDLEPLKQRIASGELREDRITRHVLNLTNTIRVVPRLVGEKFADHETQRTSSFTLELFNVDQDWDEGNGYDFVYIDEQFPQIPQQASNWFERKTGVDWRFAGAYASGSTGNTIIARQSFQDGSENFTVDITDYINNRLFPPTGSTTGTTGLTGQSFGLGLKFTDDLESLFTDDRQAVAFHVKDTETFYEPYIETIFEDQIVDDRNYFYLGKENNLLLYANAGGQPVDITVSAVTIVDFNGQEVAVASGDSIQQLRKGVYQVSVTVDDDAYPDQVIFNDVWTIVQNGKIRQITQQFYLINQDQFFSFDPQNRINFDNYFFNIIGISFNERLTRGDIRRIEVDNRQLYPDQNTNQPLELEYRLYTRQDIDRQIDVIPFTPVDRTSAGYEFLLDTSWLIPQDYFLEIKMRNGRNFSVKEPIRFSVISDGVFI